MQGRHLVVEESLGVRELTLGLREAPLGHEDAPQAAAAFAPNHVRLFPTRPTMRFAISACSRASELSPVGGDERERRSREGMAGRSPLDIGMLDRPRRRGRRLVVGRGEVQGPRVRSERRDERLVASGHGQLDRPAPVLHGLSNAPRAGRPHHLGLCQDIGVEIRRPPGPRPVGQA